jgi:hypothetical protein
MSNEELELTDIINSALTELADPVGQDNPADEVEDEVTAEVEGDEPEAEVEELEDEESEGEPEDDEDLDEDEVEESDDEQPDFYDEKVVVKVDGEEREITVKEALEGYQRREDYTRKTQELSESRQAFEQEIQQYAEVLENVEAFEASWGEDPAGVISRLAAGTENPTHALVLTIKNLAAEGALERDFLEMFGITQDVVAEWSKEAELSQVKSKVSRYEAREREAAEAGEQEQAVRSAMSQYQQQVDNIIEREGLKLNAAQKADFQRGLAAYALENNLTNLEAARKAMLFDESQTKQRITEQTKQRVSQKRKAGAVTRTGSAGNGSPVAQEPSDLRSLIESTMREIG